MEALGAEGDRASPALSPRSLDVQRLSPRADSAYSSFSAASGGPEPCAPSPAAGRLPYLDWDYVRVVWGGPAPGPPDADPCSAQRPRLAVAARTGPRPAEGQGAPGPLSREATPLLFALAAEAEAGARAAEPPSPPAARAAYRQRLQGAQRRVLRETSFQRQELRMSLPARLRPPAATHPRCASLGLPAAEPAPARSRAPAPAAGGPGRLARQQREWCLSEPGKLDRAGWGEGPAAHGCGEAWPSPGRAGPEPQEARRGARADFAELRNPGSASLGSARRPACHSQSASSEDLGPRRGSGGTMATVQAVPQGAETPRPLIPTQVSRFLSQKETAVGHAAEVPQSSPAGCEQSIPETCTVSARLPSLPDDEVFLDQALPDSGGAPPDSHAPQGLLASVQASGQQYGNGLSQRAGHIVPTECLLQQCPGPAGAAAENDPLKSLPADALRPPSSDTPGPPQPTSPAWGTGQPGSRPTWPSRRLEELAQELARLDPSLSDTLASQPSPEPPLGLLDGLVPLMEVRAAMRPARAEAGEEAAGAGEPGSYQFSFAQLLPTPQEETRPECSPSHPGPEQRCGQGLPAPNNSLQAKKVELAGLLQRMLRDLHAEQERVRAAAAAWARRRAALEAAVGRACAPRELERLRRFLADLERVLGLLLLLGSRLARVRRALARAGSDGDPDERASLLQRLGLLQRQEEDAKELKEHVARRERAVREALGRALPAEELRSYRALLAAKAAVLAQQRSLDERVRILQDQLDAVGGDPGHRSLSPRSPGSPGTCPRDTPPLPAHPI